MRPPTGIKITHLLRAIADLRAQVEGQAGADAMVETIMSDYTQADLAPPDRAMLDFATALTRDPAVIRREHLDPLRSNGFDDVAIHDIVQVTALFNDYNRLADGLGIASEPDWD